jgi:hypothetical protein
LPEQCRAGCAGGLPSHRSPRAKSRYGVCHGGGGALYVAGECGTSAPPPWFDVQGERWISAQVSPCTPPICFWHFRGQASWQRPRTPMACPCFWSALPEWALLTDATTGEKDSHNNRRGGMSPRVSDTPKESIPWGRSSSSPSHRHLVCECSCAALHLDMCSAALQRCTYAALH